MSGAAPERLATVDLARVRTNVAVLRERAGTVHLLAVVKADGYGHGAAPVARAALAGGADWLGTADLDEALALRAAGLRAPLLAWLHGAGADFAAAEEHGVDIGISSLVQLQRAAATAPGAAVQIKVDTGLSRNGVPPDERAAVFAAAAALERRGRIRVRGVFSHLANASDATDAAAERALGAAVAEARAAGLDPELTHLASTTATLGRDQSAWTMVRVGIGVYGLGAPGEAALRPAMTLTSAVAAVRRVPAGTGVSYDHLWTADRPSTLALVPVGYADGLPRAASGRAEVQIGGVRMPVRGRIAMDQVVVDAGDRAVEVGDEVVLLGDPATGAPGAADWAEWAGTIDYEIVTRIGPRVVRRHVGA